MESTSHTHRALTAGLSLGAVAALPAVAFAVTLPFEEAHAVVATVAAPFAVGGAAGVGLLSLIDAVARRRALARELEDFFEPEDALDLDASSENEGGFFGRRNAAPKGVPVIARASDALSEAEAWAEIDSLLHDASPVSCDPLRSKDIYEIALEEMRRTSQTDPVGQQAAAAYGSDGTAAPYGQDAPAAATASFMAAALGTASSSPAEVTSVIESLDEPDLSASLAQAALSVAAHDDLVDDDLPERIVEVAVADYTGHEAMWAAALAILAEDEGASLVDSMSESPLDITDAVDPERMEQIAEGANATGIHSRVNEILEEELEHVPSHSMRHTSREYLRVIQGGTMSMPRLSAEA